MKDLRLRKRQNNGRMGGDDELRIFLHHLLDCGEKGQLPHGRERRFRLVEQIQAAGADTTAAADTILIPDTTAIQNTPESPDTAIAKDSL